MKKIITLSLVTLTVAGALLLTGCGRRADRAGRGDQGTSSQPAAQVPPSAPATSTAPAGADGSDTAQVDTAQVDGDLGDTDSVLTGVDADLAPTAPHDAD